MRAMQNASGEHITARSYPIASATAVKAGQVVVLSGGKVTAAVAAQTGALLGVAAENHPGTADALNKRANGEEIMVYDNPGLIFECPVPVVKAASGSATTLVPASGDIAASAADDTYNNSIVVLKKKAADSTNTDAVGVHRTVSDYAKTGTVLTIASGGTPNAGDEYEFYPALGKCIGALDTGIEKLVVSATGATAIRVIGHDFDRSMIRCIASLHTLCHES